MDKFRLEKISNTYLRILPYETDRSRLLSNEGNIFIKDLLKTNDFPMEDFYKLFVQYGDIYCFRVGLTTEGKSIGYAFVRYKNPTDA